MKEWKEIAAFIVIGGAILFGIAFTAASFEAEAYKNVTGKDVTVWDAMFLDLRVQESIK